MSTQSATVIELRTSETDAQPRLRIYVAADGAVVFQALGDAGLRFLSAAGVDITAQTAATLTAPAGVAIGAKDGTVAIAAGQRFTSTAGTDQAHQSAVGIALQAGTDIDIHAAANVRQKAGELHRTEAKVLDLHATEKLREDANGVGHTYAGERVDYWTPWHGTGNRPHPPEHPYEGTDDIDWPPIDAADLPPVEGGA